MDQPVLRFAPSPTGYLHIGGLRTALFNYLYARHHGGTFTLRIEDTDRTRYVEGALENLIDILKWSGLDYDEGPKMTAGGEVVEEGGRGPYIQSDRVKEGIYDRYINQLLEEGKAYYCFCSRERIDRVREAQKEAGETPRYDGHCRKYSLEEAREKVAAGEDYVVRLKLPENQDITFHDAIKGDITINTDEMDDQVLIKSDGFPTYHFAVVVDDHLMGVTHVVRGEEWISSTPKHVFLYQSLGWKAPEYVHLPTVLGNDHKKLSKRQGDVAVEQFRDKGYLPEALINYIALLGWSPKSNQEVLSMEELIKEFDFDRISNTGAIFDTKKLNWFNQEYIKKMSSEDLIDRVGQSLKRAGLVDETTDPEKIALTAETYGNRIEYFDQVPEMTRHLFCSTEEVIYEEDAVEAIRSESGKIVLPLFEDKVRQAPSFDRDFAGSLVKSIQKETGIKGKDLWWPVRASVVGSTSGPDFTNTLLILGKKEVLGRLERAKTL